MSYPELVFGRADRGRYPARVGIVLDLAARTGLLLDLIKSRVFAESHIGFQAFEDARHLMSSFCPVSDRTEIGVPMLGTKAEHGAKVQSLGRHVRCWAALEMRVGTFSHDRGLGCKGQATLDRWPAWTRMRGRRVKVTPEQRAYWLANTAESPFNRWLNTQVLGPDGRLDLKKLHKLARSFGIDKEAEYAHLNPGQQRMNVGNMLRRVVTFDEDGNASDYAAHAPLQQVQGEDPRPDFVRASSARDLLRLHSQVLDELRERELVRTGNAPLGDYAETLFAKAFDWSLEPNSSKGHDAVSPAGHRYQIKARRLTSRNRSRQLSAIRRLPEGTFDYLAAVLFDQSFTVYRAVLIPHQIVVGRARRVEHTNSWRFILDDGVCSLPEVQDVTSQVHAASEGVDPITR